MNYNNYGNRNQGRRWENRNNQGNFDQRNTEDSILDWIPNDLTDVKFKELAMENGHIDNFARDNLRDLKSTQLRKFFSEVKKIEKQSRTGLDDDSMKDLYLLVPKLKYAKARQLCPDTFVNLFSKLIAKVDGSEDKKIAFKNMVNILEAVVAYHKYYYPKS